MIDDVDIMLVEDSASDAELIREALKDCGITQHLEVASDGEQALEILRHRAERPHLILLDLNLPKVSGFEVLRTIKRDPQLRVIPVIVLSNSTSQEDVLKCYANYASAYLRKPVGYDNLVGLIRATSHFWVQHTVLPRPYVYVTMASTSIIPPAPESKK